MDSITKSVIGMYSRYPYPQGMTLAERPICYIRPLIRNDAEGIVFLDVGCGTGVKTISLAHAFPRSRVIGLDLTENSLRMARRFASKMKVQNVDFVRCDVMAPLPIPVQVDFVICLGVVHHLSKPSTGLRHIAEVMKPGACALIFLYGKLGRYDLSLYKEALRILHGDPNDYAGRLQIVRRLPRIDQFFIPIGKASLGALARFRGIASRLVRPRSGADEEALAARYVDMFCHPNDNEYRIADIFDLLTGAGMEFERMVEGMPDSVEEVLDDPEILKLAKGLSRLDRYRLIECLTKPKAYQFFAVRKA